MYLCLDGNIPVGAVACFLSEEEKYQGYGELQSLYVLPGYFRKGCGRLLVEAVEQWFQEKDVSQYYLWVLRENENAQRFYRSMGITPTEDTIDVDVSGDKCVNIRWMKQLLGR